MPDPLIIKISELTEMLERASVSDKVIIFDISEPIESKKIKSISVELLRHDLVEILKAVYPIGSIFTNTTDVDPSIIFGFGTWEAFSAGRVLVGFDETQTEFDTLGKEGGEKEHTLALNELTPHNHLYQTANLWSADNSSNSGSTYQGTHVNAVTNDAGEGDPFNILQPYIVVYFWKRTG